MASPAEQHPPDRTIEVTDVEVDAAIAEADGDEREAVRALLHDIAVLAADQARQVSHGYLRGRVYLGIDSLKLP